MWCWWKIEASASLLTHGYLVGAGPRVNLREFSSCLAKRLPFGHRSRSPTHQLWIDEEIRADDRVTPLIEVDLVMPRVK